MNNAIRFVLAIGLAGAAFAQTTPPPGTQFTGVQNCPFSQFIAATSTVPVTLSGSLPAGLTFSGTVTGATISGTPTVSTPTPVTFGIVVTSGTASTYNFTITIAPPVSISPTPLPQGNVNVYYQASLMAVNGSGSYFWNEPTPGSLPPGLSSSSGYIFGTPTQTGTYNIPVRVNDALTGQFATGTVTIVINPPFAITPATLPTATVGQAYTYTFSSVYGIPPITWYWGFGDNIGPPGWTLSSAGVLTGTPSTPGPVTLLINAYDGSPFEANQFDSETFTLNVFTPVTITTSTLVSGVQGAAYAPVQLTATGGEPGYTWTALSGLPAGLTLSPAGVLSGTPTVFGFFLVQVRANDSRAGGARTATATLPLNIMPAPLVITTPAINPGTEGVAFSQQLTASGGQPPYTWALISGPLPPGLTLSSSGLLSGTPQAAGSYPVQVQVTDSSPTPTTFSTALKSQNNQMRSAESTFGVSAVSAATAFTIVINPSPLVITTTAINGGTVGVAFSQQLTAAGGQPTYSWSVTGTLPTGLTLSSSGLLSGTPQVFGTFPVQIQVADSRPQAPRTASAPFSIIISPAALAITTTSIGPGTVGTAFSQQIAAAGGEPPYFWQVTVGTLPPGLTLSSSGLLSGTPQTAGTYPVTIRATDSRPEVPRTATQAYSIVVNPAQLVITTLFLPGGPAGSPYSARLQATGGTPPYRWSLAAGSLPTGLTLSSSGDITGTPEPGVFAFSIRVNDNATQNATRQYNVSFEEVRQPLRITDVNLPEGFAGRAYAGAFGAAGGTPPYNFSISGLPQGLRAGSNGFISGTPARVGTFPISVEVNDSRNERITGTFSLVIRPGTIIIDPETVPEGRVGSGYGVQFSASGGVPPYRFSTGGSLPAGLTFTSGSAVSGTPTEAGSFTFSVQVVDAAEQKGERSYTLVVRPGQLQITTNSLPDGQVRLRYSSSVAATGGVLPYVWNIGGLPAGVSFDAQTGFISGTPSESGELEISAQVTDKSGLTASRSFKIRVRPPLILSGSLPSTLGIGAPVSSTLTASGGLPPYSWSSDGSLPPGVSFSGGSLSGSGTTGGTYSFTVRVTDTAGATAEQSASITVGEPLRVTTQSLGSGMIGAAYSASFGATGGRQPYRWSFSGLPAGLTGNSDGSISGTPTAGGSFTVSATVSDSSQPAQSASASVPLTIGMPQVSNLTIGGIVDTPPPAQQSNLTVVLGQAFPAPISGTITLTFAPDAANNADDPAIRFSTGGRSTTFTIPAGSTTANFTTPTVGIQTGTVAGVITLTTTLQSGGAPVTCNCPLTRTIRVARSAPTISSVRVTRTSTGFNVVVTGFSTTREISQGVFRFGGSNLQTSEVTVQLGQSFTSWFQSAQSAQFGGQFVLTMPFNVSGDTASVTSVTVTLTNGQGTSQPVTANF